MTTKPKTTAVSRAKERVRKLKIRMKRAETELNKAIKKDAQKKKVSKAIKRSTSKKPTKKRQQIRKKS